MAITTTSTESTATKTLQSIADRPYPILGGTGAYGLGSLVIQSGITLYLNHMYVFNPAYLSNPTVDGYVQKVDNTKNQSSFALGLWTGNITYPLGSLTMTGDGYLTTSLEQPVAWVYNDAGYPVDPSMIGKLAYATTGEHVGSQTTVTDLSTAPIAGVIEDFNSLTNQVLVNFAKKAV